MDLSRFALPPIWRERLAAAWRVARAPFFLGLGALIGFGVPYAWYLDRLVVSGFGGLSFVEPTRVYARPLTLARGLRMDATTLRAELAAARYRELPVANTPGTFHVEGTAFSIASRSFAGPRGVEPARHLAVTLADGRIAGVTDADRKTVLAEAHLDPARIATFYGDRAEERRFVRLSEVPPLLVATLQAVEDRDFKHHFGVNPWAIARAAVKNLIAGEVVQGGSTLTQQLVRNLYLNRAQHWSRKVNEALLSVLIERRYSKGQILQAYINEVYLGQQGGQAVHGMAAASEFYFGHDLASTDIAEAALLVGMIQGPSIYDPRRYPEKARERRAVVLRVMEEVGLISAVERKSVDAQPLGVTPSGALPKNRYPAFMDLVERELKQAYPDALDAAGLSIWTTLAPSTQEAAEASLASQIRTLGKKSDELQGAMVVTESKTGAVAAIVGGRDADAQGFNRALSAARPVGSLIKPFVYLVALAQPEQYSLMSVLDDSAVSVPLAGGKVWEPSNSDGREHGPTTLIDALARSYNLATVHLGLALDVRKVGKVIEALIPGTQVAPNPSLLLGAIDLSPYQMAEAYQYLAADGHPLPLFALDAVLDAQGRPLNRHDPKPVAGDLVEAARLVGFAMQETARSGTAASLAGGNLGKLQLAGKTGTTNDMRDSWFAGFTGSHLAVVWVGTDDNHQTGLYGATGAMKIWAELFNHLPSEPLQLDFSEDPLLTAVDVSSQTRTDSACSGARSLPFIRGYEPAAYSGCGMGVPEGEWPGLAGDPRDERDGRDERGYDERDRRDPSDRDERDDRDDRDRQAARKKKSRWRAWFGLDRD